MRRSLGPLVKPNKRAAVAASLAAVVIAASGCGSTIRLGASASANRSSGEQASSTPYDLEGQETKEVTLADGRVVEIPKDATIDASGNVVSSTGEVLAPVDQFVETPSSGTQSTGGTATTLGSNGDTSTTLGPTGTTQPGATTTTLGGPVSCPTKTELKMGFIVLKNSSDFSSTYLNGAPTVGDVPGQVNAVADYINKRGGVGCKTLKPVFRNYDSQSASVANENTICTGFAQDDKVFAVSMQAMIHQETRKCYNDKGVLAFDDSAFGMGSSIYQANKLFWNPGYPDYSRAEKALVPSLADRGFFAGGKVGIVAFSDDTYKRVVRDDLRPALSAKGVTVADGDIYYVDNSGIQSMETGFGVAIAGFTSSGVNRVLFVGTTPLAPFFITTAKARNFTPRYGLTTFDNPRYMENDSNLNSLMKGSMGIGFNPGGDVADARFPFPAAGLETTCRDIIKAAGKEPPTVNRANYRYGIAHCETMLLFAAGAKDLGTSMTPTSWTAAAEGLGSSFQVGSSFGTFFGPGRHDGASEARELTFVDGCSCFQYGGSLALGG